MFSGSVVDSHATFEKKYLGITKVLKAPNALKFSKVIEQKVSKVHTLWNALFFVLII